MEVLQSPDGGGGCVLITVEGVQALIEALRDVGFRTVGPTLRDDAIVYDDIEGVGDLPVGWTDRQEAGRYAPERRSDEALFGYNVGPHSWKKFLFPPAETLWRAERSEAGKMEVAAPVRSPEKFAFIGMRACELHAVAIQDKVLCEGDYSDEGYHSRRCDSFFVAVNCGQAGGTCFCASMGTGPRAQAGFDLALTELIGPDGHRFLVEVGSEAGARIVEGLPTQPATPEDMAAAAQVSQRAEGQMGRSLETNGLKELLQANPDHPRWDDVAGRCLTCGNCTMVCPTCFCTTVEDQSDLGNTSAERVRKWDSCFTLDFSFIHGGSVRASAKSRYRQWMTHKLANWIDQFGTSGCVGCGRCITWCPTGIDITQEAAAIRAATAEAEQS